MNAQTVQQAAKERLRNGLATLPDVLEARSASAPAQYDLQAVLGAEQIARGNLATALGASARTLVRVQALREIRLNRSRILSSKPSFARLSSALICKLGPPRSTWRRRSNKRGLPSIPA